MDQHRMQVVASGDYLHTRGSDSLETLGFDAYARVASRIAVTPLSAGGGWELANGQGLCRACHNGKTARERAARGRG